MKILPSPLFPVRAAAINAVTISSRRHLYLYFGKKIHFALLATINFLVALLASVPGHFTDPQALCADSFHRILYFV